jgi:hypothetical protein
MREADDGSLPDFSQTFEIDSGFALPANADATVDREMYRFIDACLPASLLRILHTLYAVVPNLAR